MKPLGLLLTPFHVFIEIECPKTAILDCFSFFPTTVILLIDKAGPQ